MLNRKYLRISFFFRWTSGCTICKHKAFISLSLLINFSIVKPESLYEPLLYFFKANNSFLRSLLIQSSLFRLVAKINACSCPRSYLKINLWLAWTKVRIFCDYICSVGRERDDKAWSGKQCYFKVNCSIYPSNLVIVQSSLIFISIFRTSIWEKS